MAEFKYFKNAKTQQDATKRYRELAKKYHPDLAVSDEERICFNSIMQEINAEHQEVLVLLKYKKFEPIPTIEEVVVEENSPASFLEQIASIFTLTTKQKEHLVLQGKHTLNFIYDAVVENNLK
jgi:hypothetical protein